MRLHSAMRTSYSSVWCEVVWEVRAIKAIKHIKAIKSHRAHRRTTGDGEAQSILNTFLACPCGVSSGRKWWTMCGRRNTWKISFGSMTFQMYKMVTLPLQAGSANWLNRLPALHTIDRIRNLIVLQLNVASRVWSGVAGVSWAKWSRRKKHNIYQVSSNIEYWQEMRQSNPRAVILRSMGPGYPAPFISYLARLLLARDERCAKWWQSALSATQIVRVR